MSLPEGALHTGWVLYLHENPESYACYGETYRNLCSYSNSSYHVNYGTEATALTLTSDGEGLDMLLECEDCGWRGEQEECDKRYLGVPGWDVEPILQCPKCNSENLKEIDRD